MARGSKYSDEQKEKALAMLATNTDIKKVARDLGIPRTTLIGWQAEAITKVDNSNFVQLRQKKKEEFINKAWESIEMALELGNKRVRRALENEAELDELIDMIEDEYSDSKDHKTKTALVNKIRTLQIQGIRDISTFIGTLYDKSALANGESTANNTHIFEIKDPFKGDTND